MKGIKEVKLSYWAHHLTTIISVTLVLLLMGIIALIWLSADAETRRLKERIEISVIMTDTVAPEVTRNLADHLSATPYARNVKVITRQEALDNWTRDTGENLEELFGVNPLSEEISFALAADYASAAQIAEVEKTLSDASGVEAVSLPDAAMVESMNRNLGRVTLVLGIIAAIMMIISFVLINNTVHLTIHSRRFLIHTMQLVGATNGFIRRPVVLNNMLAGLIAALIAVALMAIPMAGSSEIGFPDLTAYVAWPKFGIVAACLVAVGVLLCGVAAWCSATLYLRKDYDRLFR